MKIPKECINKKNNNIMVNIVFHRHYEIEEERINHYCSEQYGTEIQDEETKLEVAEKLARQDLNDELEFLDSSNNSFSVTKEVKE